MRFSRNGKIRSAENKTTSHHCIKKKIDKFRKSPNDYPVYPTYTHQQSIAHVR
jgi:hypothetical protein